MAFLKRWARRGRALEPCRVPDAWETGLMADGIPSISAATEAKVRRAWPALIAAVADGSNIGDVCELAGITRDHVRNYRALNGTQNAEWLLAREQSADAFADKVAEIANNPGADSARARVQMDAYRWLASKRNPRTYSDKATLDVNVRTVDLTRVIRDAQERLALARAPRIIEHQRPALAAPPVADEVAAALARDAAQHFADLL